MTDGLMHRVCALLRQAEGYDNCQQCAMEVQTPYGTGSPACALRAREMIETVRAASVPSVRPEFEGRTCPFTKRGYMMHIEHPERGHVPTFGGPFDSYTIPEPDDDGHLRCERYDHDAGHWVEGGAPTGLCIMEEFMTEPAPPPAETHTDCLHCRWPPGTDVDVAYGADDAPQWERGTVVVNPEIRVRFDNDDSPMEIVFKESRLRRHVEEPTDG